MKIEQISIQGFRGFREKITIDLHPNVTVFVGVNGSGKTSVLDAVARLLILTKVYNIGAQNGHSVLDIMNSIDVNHFENKYTLGITVIGEFAASWKLIQEKNERGQLDMKDYSDQSRKNDIKRYDFDYEYDEGLDLKVYYNINRNSNKEISNVDESLSAWNPELQNLNEALDTSFNNFSAFEDWFIEKENTENRIKLKRKDLEYQDANLKAIRTALQIFNEEILDSAYEGAMYIDVMEEFTPNSKPKLFIKKQGQEFRLDSLSDGEKNVMLMVCDITRRLLDANSDLSGKGVVLIDEIELHLHPSWQRKLVPALTKVFPNIQFILTTHSPQVLSNLKEENIRVIEDFKLVKDINPIYGEDSNDILWNIFGVKKRPLHAEEKFSNFYRLLETDQQKAKEALGELETIYGAEHTEVKKAQMDYEFEFGEYKFSEDETD